jgi:hypothetical protein
VQRNSALALRRYELKPRRKRWLTITLKALVNSSLKPGVELQCEAGSYDHGGPSAAKDVSLECGGPAALWCVLRLKLPE